MAKAVIGLPTIERLMVDKQLRRLCGWERPADQMISHSVDILVDALLAW